MQPTGGLIERCHIMQESKRILEVNCIKIKEGKYQINRKFFFQFWIYYFSSKRFLCSSHAGLTNSINCLQYTIRCWRICSAKSSNSTEYLARVRFFVHPRFQDFTSSLYGFFKKVTNRGRRKKDRRKKDWHPVWYDTSIYFLSVFIRCFRKTRTKLSCGESRVVFGFYALLNWPNIFCL